MERGEEEEVVEERCRKIEIKAAQKRDRGNIKE